MCFADQLSRSILDRVDPDFSILLTTALTHHTTRSRQPDEAKPLLTINLTTNLTTNARMPRRGRGAHLPHETTHEGGRDEGRGDPVPRQRGCRAPLRRGRPLPRRRVLPGRGRRRGRVRGTRRARRSHRYPRSVGG